MIGYPAQVASITEEREHSVPPTSYRLSAVFKREKPLIHFGGFSLGFQIGSKALELEAWQRLIGLEKRR